MSWSDFYQQERKKPYFNSLLEAVKAERKEYTVYPEAGSVFRLFQLLEPEAVKVVILGQDPYPGVASIGGKEQPYAMGMSFSVQKESPLPASLQNIFKELEADLGVKRTAGDLTDWVKQGVFLLNTYLTVRKGEPMSHHHLDWPLFTGAALDYVLACNPNAIFILWGGQAKKSVQHLPIRYRIESAHPSPLSAYRGFFGSRPFSRCNRLLREQGEAEVSW